MKTRGRAVPSQAKRAEGVDSWGMDLAAGERVIS